MPDLESSSGFFVWLLVAGLATARGTRLIVSDKIMEPLRLWAWRMDPQMRNIGYLISCPYCTGIWVSLVVCSLIVAAQAFGWVIAAPAVVLAVAQVGILAERSGAESSLDAAPWPEDHR